MTTAIWITLIVLSIFFVYVLTKDVLKHWKVLERISTVKTALIGFVVNFFDVLGIGAFAPQTALLKFTKQTEDRVLPGTLNVANTIPVLIQALIFIQIVEVEAVTLVSMLLSATAGAVLGVGVVSRLPTKQIRSKKRGSQRRFLSGKVHQGESSKDNRRAIRPAFLRQTRRSSAEGISGWHLLVQGGN